MIAAAPWSSAAAAAATSSAAPSTPSAREPRSPATPHRKKSPPSWAPEVGEMKSWGCPWFPFVLESLREAAAKSPSPLTKEGYRGFRIARQHDTRQPAPGNRDGLDHRPSSEPHSSGGS